MIERFVILVHQKRLIELKGKENESNKKLIYREGRCITRLHFFLRAGFLFVRRPVIGETTDTAVSEYLPSKLST